MAFVGLLYAVAAPIQQETDGQPIIYGKGQVVGGMMTAEISYTRNSNPLYADDRVKEEDNSITGGTIKLGVDDASDEARYTYLLNKLGRTEERSARFVCCICCTMPDGTVLRSRGECEGEILYGPRGTNGFGYDPVFRPLGQEKSMAELTPGEKNAISHRGKALREFIKIFEENINANNK